MFETQTFRLPTGILIQYATEIQVVYFLFYLILLIKSLIPFEVKKTFFSPKMQINTSLCTIPIAIRGRPNRGDINYQPPLPGIGKPCVHPWNTPSYEAISTVIFFQNMLSLYSSFQFEKQKFYYDHRSVE